MDNANAVNKAPVETAVLTTQEKIAEFIKKNIYDVAIALICIVYMLRGVAQIEETGQTAMEIFGGCFVNLVFSLAICKLFDGRGLMAGNNSKEYKDALKEYRETAKRAGKYITEMDEWCAKWTHKNHKTNVTTMLYPLGVSYDQFVAGDYDTSKFTDEQKETLEKVKKLKVYTLTTWQLMSGELDSKEQMDYSKTTIKGYLGKSTLSDIATKGLIIALLGYFTLSPIETWDWTGFLWTAFQAVLTLCLSVLKYFNAYSFVTGDMKAKLIDKKNKLNLFIEEIEAKEGQENVNNEKK